MSLFRRMFIFVVIVLLLIGITGCVGIGYGGTRASGGGMIIDTDELTSGECAVFGFTVKLAEPFDGTYIDGIAMLDANGVFQLVDKANDFRIHVSVTAIEIMEANEYMDVATNIILFFGTAVLDGQMADVTIAAGDFSDQSDPDQIAISVTVGETECYVINGEIAKGNIKVS